MATTQLEVQKIASRYAKALFDHVLGLDGGSVGETTQNLMAWFGVLAEVLADHPELVAFLNNPTVDGTQKLNMIGDSFKAETVAMLPPFLKLVAENDRLSMLPAIGQQFCALVDEAKRIKDAYVTVPIELTKTLAARFETRLKEAFELSDVRLHVTVDPDVIAGAIVRIGDQLIDGSAAGFC